MHVPSQDLQPEHWFSYPIQVHPHHTDYAGVVWHGSYIAWLEEARIDCLRQVGIEFSDLVAMGCDLPVVRLGLNYHRAVRMGEVVVVKSRLVKIDRIRLYWEQNVLSADEGDRHLSAQVELVPVNREVGRVLRQLPPQLIEALKALSIVGQSG
jgi:acyl-CoA thioester hydrolase